ncbi:iron ABC transporter substrate-binding protein [Cocleimonas sp. KMM 6892]|uniref:iron ABC transporter substrate-binding protein n=1 Tax=unclassified Cocleimonas TaxID=2639732 RepID=UPI002DB60397|nr:MULTISPECIES: iron ABC transporter substrate-binding protein [unclassified Cocleimonas]MEB8432283.1 iron ABC transporter substrate-binding protein [Cocleimonas sp. KMM 6892]MEC4714631.1 iron ABC transporter substrate-binding protein [Cocleimonas sp. KMM 6895]MEC4744555.1 iron ABC transporter substrate-binding protein [Cocleimonas sp. KMM 6896]
MLIFTTQLLSIQFASAQNITDSAGRTVEVPENIQRIYAAGAPAAILIYILAPDMLLGWPREPHDYEREYIASPYRDLPATGQLTGRGSSANLEKVLALKPDLILDFGSVKGTYASLADRTQQQTGIPYLLINGRFDKTADALRLLGKAIGREDRAEKLAVYTENLLSDIKQNLQSIDKKDRPRVYMARGPAGLETGLKGSINTEIIEQAGGINVIDPGEGKPIRRGLVNLSMEQVIVANPDIIITWDRTFFADVWDNPYWSNIPALQQEHVYLAPTAPFGWIDRPPSLNRLIGLKWLFGQFYPDKVKTDLRDDVKEFYKLFYHVDLENPETNNAALKRLIQWAEKSK